MGLFSSGSSSLRRAKKQALASIKNAEADMTTGYQEVLGALRPYDTDAAFWNRYQTEVLGTGPSQFEMTPMMQQYQQAKQQEVAQLLANSGMQFSGAGMEALGATAADVKQQLYQQYMQQLMGGIQGEFGILGQKTGTISDYYGGLAEADMARGNVYMQYGQQKAAAQAARSRAIGQVAGMALGAAGGFMLGPAMGFTAGQGLMGGAMLGSMGGGAIGGAG